MSATSDSLQESAACAPSPDPSPEFGGGEHYSVCRSSGAKVRQGLFPLSQNWGRGLGGGGRLSRRTWAGLVVAVGLTACATAPPSERRVIATPAAPAAVGAYSQAIQVGNTLYVAGQIGIVPATGQLIEGGIEAQTRQALENVRAILQAAGFGLEQVVQAQVFLADLNDFPAYNRVYGEFFPTNPPARATVQAARIPRDARVEIMVTAVR